jgi:hypothetical protein
MVTEPIFVKSADAIHSLIRSSWLIGVYWHIEDGAYDPIPDFLFAKDGKGSVSLHLGMFYDPAKYLCII